MALKSFDDGDSDEARQALLDRRCERNHPKRHGTKKRTKALAAKKKAQMKAKARARVVSFRQYKAKVRAYWAGESNEHPRNRLAA